MAWTNEKILGPKSEEEKKVFEAEAKKFEKELAEYKAATSFQEKPKLVISGFRDQRPKLATQKKQYDGLVMQAKRNSG